MKSSEFIGRIYRPATDIETDEAISKVRAMYKPLDDGPTIAEFATLVKVEAFKDRGDSDWRIRVNCDFEFVSSDNMAI
jgi:hypothetical protein